MEASKTHFGFTNMGSEMHIFRVIAIWNSKLWFGSPYITLEERWTAIASGKVSDNYKLLKYSNRILLTTFYLKVYIEACQVHYVFCAIFYGIFGHLKWVSSPIVVLDLKNWDLTRLLRRTFIVDNSVNFALFQLLKQFIKVTHGWSDIHCPLKSRNRLEHQVYFSRSMRFKKKKKTRHVNRIPLLWKKRNSSPSLKSI